jgi:C4-type Zn-finger protein
MSHVQLPPKDEGADELELDSDDEDLLISGSERMLCLQCNSWVSMIRMANTAPTTFTTAVARCRVCDFRLEKVEIDEIKEQGVALTMQCAAIGDGDDAAAAAAHAALVGLTLVASPVASLEVVECGLEIETGTHHGKYQTVATLLAEVAQNLEDQATSSGIVVDEDDDTDAAVAGGDGDNETIQSVMLKLRRYIRGAAAFTLKARDASGCCFLFNPETPSAAVAAVVSETFDRSDAETAACAAMLEKQRADAEQRSNDIKLAGLADAFEARAAIAAKIDELEGEDGDETEMPELDETTAKEDA